MDRLDGFTDGGTVPDELGCEPLGMEKVHDGFLVLSDEAACTADVDEVSRCPLNRQMRRGDLGATVDDVADVP